MYLKNVEGVFSREEIKNLKILEKKKDRLLESEEKLLRLKSRALWLEAGEKNQISFTTTHHTGGT